MKSSHKITNPKPSIGTHRQCSLLFLQYLNDTLGDFVRTIIMTEDDCEVDPTKVPIPAMLQRHQMNLRMFCDMAWSKIITSFSFFPRFVFILLLNAFPQTNKPCFLRVCNTSLLKTQKLKEKLLITSNFSFYHCVFYLYGELSAIFIIFEIVVCKLFQFGRA